MTVGTAAATAVGVDVGGTKIAAGRVRSDGTVTERLERPTPPDGASILAAVGDVVHKLGGGGTLPVGVAVAGMLSPDGRVEYGTNLAWDRLGLAARLREVFGDAVSVVNDGNAAAWAEYHARRDEPPYSLLTVTVGTGVGGGLVHRGDLFGGVAGLGAEIGHMIVLEGGPQCSCGNRGCLQALASGHALARGAREAIAAGSLSKDSAMRGLKALTGTTVGRLAVAGDADAQELVRSCGFWLGVGLASLVNLCDPALIVVTGGPAVMGDMLLGPAREACRERIAGRSFRVPPPVEAAARPTNASLAGAALLAIRDHAAA
jgi:glucokinase